MGGSSVICRIYYCPGRFQPKATVVDNTRVVEGADQEVGDRKEASVAQKIEESDDDVGRCL
jgi:hypothetical protein